MDVTEIMQACHLLEQAEIKKWDLHSRGSNYIYILEMVKDGTGIKSIYKPRHGEIPLWDFPDGTLYKREYAAFILSQALEWHLIPPTIIRSGPFGMGSMQWFVNTSLRAEDYDRLAIDLSVMQQVVVFDCLVNNADRKAGHFLLDDQGRLWVVDHGLTFNRAPKLRTVIWDFAGQNIPQKLVADVALLEDKLKRGKQLSAMLHQLLDEAEVAALEFRIRKIIKSPVFPYPESRRSIPWPWI